MFPACGCEPIDFVIDSDYIHIHKSADLHKVLYLETKLWEQGEHRPCCLMEYS